MRNLTLRYVNVCLVLIVPTFLNLTVMTSVRGDEAAFFESRIRPLLHEHCVKCHGENQSESGLRLDSLDAVLEGGESGPAIVIGEPDESLLMEAIRYESFEMPPVGSLSDAEIEAFEKWIEDGAVWPSHDDVPVRTAAEQFSDDDRKFWSLQPIRSPAVPDAGEGWARNEIDRFVADRHQAKGIRPASQASESVLRRRLSFHLIGLPPTAVDFREPMAFEDAVDLLLNDPRFGEHWARHWLDVVRYAESDGFRADFYRPNAWRYRDYIVAAFNNDKPYDQFVAEQVAGDEIAPDSPDALAATGFLRTWLYEYNQRDARTQWQDILNQMTDVTGEAFLGLGYGCARCHDHKFDPILQADYFRLQACFGSVIPQDDVPLVTAKERAAYLQRLGKWEQQTESIRSKIAELERPYFQKARKGAVERFPADVQAIMAKPDAVRSVLDRQLADLVERQVTFDQQKAKLSKADQEQLQRLKDELKKHGPRPSLPLPGNTVVEAGPEPQAIHLNGDEKRDRMSPGGLTILDENSFAVRALERSTGQRQALAEWLTDKEHPLVARVIVNRIWQQHFGEGLVRTASDFGSLGGRPSHPDLLDWLAAGLQENDWSLKWLHRKILTSATWQMASFHREASSMVAIDPDNRLLWKSDIRRLQAEQIRDAMLSVSGELLSDIGGASVSYDSPRRSLYLKAMRNTPEPLLRSLDGVDGLNSVPKRSTTTTPTQALNLLNGDWVRQRSLQFAKRVKDEVLTDQREPLIRRAFQLALDREPTSEEVASIHELSTGDSLTSLNESRFQHSQSPRLRTVVVDEHREPLRTESVYSTPADFSVSGTFVLRSLYPDATVRTLVAAWDSQQKSRGWSIGVTSQKSAYEPRNLILQIVGDGGYQVVTSNLRPELNQAYRWSVSVTSSGDSRAATFALQAVGEGDVTVIEVPIVKACHGLGGFPITIGGRTDQKKHRWDGWLADIRLHESALPVQRPLQPDAAPLSTLVGHWSFAEENPFLNSAGNRKLDLIPANQRPPEFLTELCHVLLNCNEFVYVD